MEISDSRELVSVVVGYTRHELCIICSDPVLHVLKSYKLVK